MLNASIALREHGHRSGRRGPAMKVNTSRLQNRLTLLIVLIVAPLLAASVQNGFSQRKALMKQVELDCLELLGYVESHSHYRSEANPPNRGDGFVRSRPGIGTSKANGKPSICLPPGLQKDWTWRL